MIKNMKKMVIIMIKKCLNIYSIIFHYKIGKTKSYFFVNNVYNEKEIDIECKEKQINEFRYNLSVIIPIYNSEKFIESCLNSIINQKTKYTYEIICINDGSKDNSLNVLRKYEGKYSNIKVINQKNQGPSVARNTGLNIAKGEYIAFIDSDDIVKNEYIEKLLNNAYQNNADIVKCGYYEYDIINKVKLKDVTMENFVIDGKINNDFTKINGFLWAMVIKRSLWGNIRFPSNYWYEDMITRMIIYPRCNKFVYIKDELYCYNNHQENISKKIQGVVNTRCLDQFFLAKKLHEYNKKSFIELTEGYYNALIYEMTVVLWLRIRKINRKLKKEIFKLSCTFINENIPIEYIKDNKLAKICIMYDYMNWQVKSLEIILSVKYGI